MLPSGVRSRVVGGRLVLPSGGRPLTRCDGVSVVRGRLCARRLLPQFLILTSRTDGSVQLDRLQLKIVCKTMVCLHKDIVFN